jgi:integrase
LAEQGYVWPHLPQNALLLFWEECTTRHPPLSERPLRKNATLYAWWRGLRRTLEVLQWAGVELPRLELPPKPRYALVRPYLSEKEFKRLLEAAHRHPEGRLRRLGVALLYLLGESGVWPKEIFALRLEDFTGQALRIRGRRARTLPLSKEATGAIRDYLEDRESVASLSPLPSVYLFLRMTNKKGGLGRPLTMNTLNALLQRVMELAQVFPEHIIGSLRWRAVRRYLHEGLSPAEVAERTGLASVAELGRLGDNSA